MRLIFVHGWSVTHTKSYGDFPESLAARAKNVGLDIDVAHIYLGKYISFHDEVTLEDIASAFDYALRELPDAQGHASGEIAPFSCITHSTGGPVVRTWIDKYYGKLGKQASLDNLPLKHLVMLAPANHGSSLAVLGKQRVGRIKAWFNGVEPGEKVLDWLSLGSDGQWQLNHNALNYHFGDAGGEFYPFVFAGQGIDSKFYDFLNNYLIEPGSDGVIRVAGANLNYRYLSLSQSDDLIDKTKLFRIKPDEQSVRYSPNVPLAVMSCFSHSGTKMGIMSNKAGSDNHQLIIEQVLRCLLVDSAQDYRERAQQMAELTIAEQQKIPVGKDQQISRYAMLVVRVRDEHDKVINNQDYDFLLLAGKQYKPHLLPQGFFIDRQMNTSSHSLVYYLDAEKMLQIKDGCFGIQVTARPDAGFSYYAAGQFRSEGLNINEVLAPNQVTYIDIRLRRKVDKNVFRFSRADQPRESFARVKPSGEFI